MNENEKDIELSEDNKEESILLAEYKKLQANSIYKDKYEKDIAELEAILASKQRVKTIIVKELKNVADKYGKDRVSELLYNVDESNESYVERL